MKTLRELEMFESNKAFVKKLLQKYFAIYLVKNKNKLCGISELKHVDNFLDLGANAGSFALKLPELCNIELDRVIFVEPDPRYKNILNNIRHRSINEVCFEPVCVGNVEGTVVFNTYQDGTVNSLLESASAFGDATKIQVKCTTGANLVEKYGLQEFDVNLVKLDVQGSEADVLHGFGDHLRLFTIIICEISIKEYYHNQSQFIEICNFLAATHGYVGNLGEVYNENGTLDYMNAVFLRHPDV